MEKDKNWEGEKNQSDDSKKDNLYQSRAQLEGQESTGQSLIDRVRKGSLRLIILLVLSFLAGVLIKVEARNYITIGAEDYKLKRFQSDFNLGHQSELKEENQTEEDQASKETEPSNQDQTEETENADE